MAYPDSGTASGRSNSLDVLLRFTELALAELNGSAAKTRAHSAAFGALCSSDETANPDASDRQPFGLVFRGGQRAVVNMPPGRRFVIEYVNVVCWGPSRHLLVQLQTTSRNMFRNFTLYSAFDELSGAWRLLGLARIAHSALGINLEFSSI